MPKVGGKEGEMEEQDLVEEFFSRIQDPQGKEARIEMSFIWYSNKYNLR